MLIEMILAAALAAGAQEAPPSNTDVLAHADRNHDGVVDRAELIADATTGAIDLARATANAEAVFKWADANSDGGLDRAERDRIYARHQLAAAKRPQPSNLRGEILPARLDAGGER